MVFRLLVNFLRKRLLSMFQEAYPQVSFKVIFRTTFRVNNLFVFKDEIHLRLKSNVRSRGSDCSSNNVTGVIFQIVTFQLLIRKLFIGKKSRVTF